jgi:hexosaminidase
MTIERLALIPIPATAEFTADEDFEITAATTIRADAGADADHDELLRIARYLSDWIGGAAAAERLRVEPGSTATSHGDIRLQLGEVAEPGDEAYELTIAASGVLLKARRPAGVFYGVQTLRQLLPAFVEHEAARFVKSRPARARACRVADAPRFQWRGLMLDVARHFMSVEDVERCIDLMALHKLNRLHLHLSDDQGWRIEITSWPNLATHGGSTDVGGGPGGFYSQAEYASIVSYARDRFITIVPEIDMPGHTHAALASYPELTCDGRPLPLYSGIAVGFSTLSVDKEITGRFIGDVVREIAALTPGRYFHIGGDEVRTLTPEQYLQFIERVQTIVQSYGKETIGWDEISPARLLPTTIVQHWRPEGTPAQAVEKGAKVIMSVANRTYLDMQYDEATPIGLHWAGYVGVQQAYDWDPATAATGVPESALLGVEAPLWTETVANIRDVEYLAFPRLAALAEVGWSRMERRGWEDFRVRAGAQALRWAALGISYFRSPEIPWI